MLHLDSKVEFYKQKSLPTNSLLLRFLASSLIDSDQLFDSGDSTH